MVETPTLQPAFMGEWSFSTAITAPPANAQIRMNNAQNKPTLIWVNNISFNGIDASAWLMEMVTGYVIRLQDKNDTTLWQTYTIVGDPVAQSGYVELKTAWLAGGKPLVITNNIMVSVISSVIRPTGTAAMARVGNAVGSTSVRIPVTTPGLTARTNDFTDVTGQLMTFDYFHPFQGLHLTSPGITKRQWYAGQALIAFSSNSVTANLMGRIGELCFRVADQLLAFEAKEAAGTEPKGAVPRPPSPAPAPPPQSAPATVTEAQVMALRKKDAEAA